MNKVYSIIQNAVLDIWVVVSELTKGKKRSSSRKTVVVLAVDVLSTTPMQVFIDLITDTDDHNTSTDYQAGISVGDYTGIHDYGLLYKSVTASQALNINGAIPTISLDQSGVVESATIRELLQTKEIVLKATSPDQGVKTITNTEELAGYLTYNRLSTLSQSTEFSVGDPAFPGEPAPIEVFDIRELSSLLTESQIGDLVLNTYDPTLSKIYRQFGTALATNGSIANLDIGNDTLNTRGKANTIGLPVKDSPLLGAQDAGGQANWQSDDYIKFNAVPVIPGRMSAGSAQTSVFGDDVTLMPYGHDVNGKVIETGTHTFNVTNTQELADLNNWLLGKNSNTAENLEG